MTPCEVEEYKALRATIRERGSLRIVAFLAAIVAWAATTIATATLWPLPVATLVPLVVLVAAFETTVALHVAVERIGRYLQVFYDEGPSTREWERTAMAYGRAFPGGGPHPLFPIPFCLATLLNFAPILLADPVRIELVVVGGVHLVFIARIAAAHRAAGRQRAIDLERFERLKQAVEAAEVRSERRIEAG